MLFPTPLCEKYSDEVYALRNYQCDYDPIAFMNTYGKDSDDVTLQRDAMLKKEEYYLTVCADGISIRYSTDEGLYRAATSLGQLAIKQNGKLKYAEIHDMPDFENRGYMLDISRGKVPKLHIIKKLIDNLSLLKYNEFQLYMESFVYKYESFPALTADFDCLTPEDIEELDRYCKERYIDLVPNQNSLGHMRMFLERDEFRHLKVGAAGDYPSSTVNPLLPESFEFITTLYRDLLPHFSSGKVNIGLDEAWELHKYELEEPASEIGVDKIFTDWLTKLSDHIEEKYGKSVQFWADMVYKYPNAYKYMPKNATALVWGYDVINTSCFEGVCAPVAERGIDFYICPGDGTWECATCRFDMMALNVRKAADVGKKYGAKGYLLTAWGNTGTVSFPIFGVVPYCLAALYAWRAGEYSDWNPKIANIQLAKNYADEFIFRAPLSSHLHKLSRYYLLEPFPTHNETVAMRSLKNGVTDNFFFADFSVTEMSDPAYYSNASEYMSRTLEAMKDIDIDPKTKAEIECDAKTVILGEELNLLRFNPSVAKEKLDYLISLAESIASEFKRLWLIDNHEHGVEIFLTTLAKRCSELKALRKERFGE